MIKALMASVAGFALFAAPGAYAEQGDVKADATNKTKSSFEEIVVTGRVGGAQITKFESSNSITTFDQNSLREIAPAGLDDIFAQVPGVWAETSGGQAGNNVFVRGAPAPGQFLFSKITVNGLPLIEEFGIFAPPDGLFRVDETVERMEAVRGGTSSIFASNAPAGVFNFITKKGTQDFEGVAKVEWGDFGHTRGDLFFSGPLDDKTTYAIGGFYRQSTGVRDAGFRGDRGGQFRVTITRELDRGELNVHASYLNDRNIFYLPIPTQLNANGGLTSIPGFNANYDTLVTDDIRLATFVQPGGRTETFDIADGLHSIAKNFGVDFDYDLGDSWTLSNKAKFTSGITDLNSNIIFGFDDAQTFINDKGYLAKAQAAFAGTQSLAVRFAGDGVGSTSTFGFAGPGSAGNNGNGLLGESGFFSWRSVFENFFNELQISKPVEMGGSTHNLTFGSYTSLYSYDQRSQISTFLHEIKGSPQIVDIFAVDGSGNVIGAVTQNGFSRYGAQYENYAVNGSVFAGYISDEWEVNDRLRIDLGIRYERQEFNGSIEIPASFNVSTDNALIPTGGLQTLADDNVTFGTGQFISFRQSQSQFAFSAGANYVIKDWISAYIRASDGFRTPSVDSLAVTALSSVGTGLTGSQATNALPVNSIRQYEGGFKIDHEYVRAFITGFLSDFSDLVSGDPVQDRNGNILNVQTLLSSRTYGLETELDVGPFYGFSVNFKGTFQKSQLQNFSFTGPDASGLDLSAVSTKDLVGNRVQRIPARLITVRPKYEFTIGEYDGSIFVNIFHVGDRFSDVTNNIVLKGYTTFGLGGTLDIGEHLGLTAMLENVGNTIGLTEGNPRKDQFSGAGNKVTATFGRPVQGRNFRISLRYSF